MQNIFFCLILEAEKEENMKNNTLIKLRDNITGTYSDEDIIWLIKDLDDYETEKSFLKAHSREELVRRAMEGHRQIQNGECYTNEEAMAILGLKYKLETA